MKILGPWHLSQIPEDGWHRLTIIQWNGRCALWRGANIRKRHPWAKRGRSISWGLYPRDICSKDHTFYNRDREQWIYPFKNIEEAQQYMDDLLIKNGFILCNATDFENLYQKLQLLQ
jgi:hypothetical protein